MIGQSSVKSAIGADLSISTEMSNAIETWALMYQNQAPWLSRDILSLNLPASIANEIARAVTIEMKVTLSGSARAKWLQEQIDRIIPMLRAQTEYGCAKGGLILKPFASNGQIVIDFIQADQFYPVAFDASGRITACVFADTRVVGKDYFTRLEYHRLENTVYTIRNMAFKSDTKAQLGQQVSLSALSAWVEIQPETTISPLTRPLFGYFRYPMANNIDPTSPLGVSCYARATDTIEQADRQYTNLAWEFESGKRAMYVDDTAFDQDAKGKPVLPDKRLYRPISYAGNVGEGKLFEEWSPQFREASIITGLDTLLKKIEFQAGLAYGTISDPNSVERTATEIASARQRSQATITDTQKALRVALDELLYAMDAYALFMPSMSLTVPRGTWSVVYDFDDSLIVDRAAQRLEDRQDVNLGVMAKWRYLMSTRGLSEEEAKRWIAEAESEKPEPTTFGSFGGAQ